MAQTVRGVDAVITDTLYDLGNIFGLGSFIDGMIRRATGVGMDTVYDQIIMKIDNEIAKLRGTNNEKLTKASNLLNDLAMLPSSQAFKSKINKIKRDTIQKIANLDQIDKRITNYEGLLKNQASAIQGKNYFTERSMEKGLNKQIDNTIQALKNDIGDNNNNGIQ